MSVIAWDGQTLAADRQLTCDGAVYHTTKVFNLGDRLIGYVGELAQCEELLEWYLAGAAPDTFPSWQREPDTKPSLAVFNSDNTILLYEGSHVPIRIENQRFAMGSGAQFALGVMHFNGTAIAAVRIASNLDPWSGGGIDALRHGDKVKARFKR